MNIQQAAAVLEVSPEFIRRRIIKDKIKARYFKGSPKLGYVLERAEFARFLRSIGEEERAEQVESGEIPEIHETDVLS